LAAITTKAIVLNAIKYSESSLIVKCFTKDDGLKSYLLRGILKPKKKGITAAYFQQLTQLKIVANHNTKNALNSLKEVHVENPYKTIYTNIVKQTIVLFLSEVLANTIQEEEKNEHLYHFLETAFIWLDVHDKIANFHILFLLNLTKFLGFYPDTNYANKNGFHLKEGYFTEFTSEKNIISGNQLYQFKKCLGINFDELEKVSFSKKERQLVLQTIIRYFELHLDGFRNPKSLPILEAVFN
jgi:DNA repair protein RecO (recombination protein O)